MRFENVACCDDCWWDVDENNEPTLNGRGRTEEGSRLPYRFKNQIRDLDRCHFCGFTTFSGIYIRTDVDAKPAAEPRERVRIE
jgi:hypothetical protein